jgi:hypothetical protein
MLDAATMVNPPLSVETEGRARTLTTAKAHAGSRPVASLSRRSVTEIRTKETFAILFAIDMHVIGLKIGAKSEIALSTNNVRKGSMITMAPTMTSPTDNVLQTEDAMKGGGGQGFLS